MRRIIQFLAIGIIILTMAACGRTGDASKAEVSGNELTKQSGETSRAAVDKNKTTNSKADNTAAGQKAQKPVSKVEGSAGVVAKSNNVVSGEDNGAVMEDLDKELDTLFSSINKLDDVDDSELDLN